MGSWSLIVAPSLFALIPLILKIVLQFKGMNNIASIMVGILVGALMMGLDLGQIATGFADAMGSSAVLIGMIVLLGAGLGALMTEAHVTHTLVYWIVKRVGVNTQTKGKIVLIVCSILICGLLGTLGGGNAVIAPIILPIMATLGVVPTVVAVLFKVSGEVGLMLGPLTGVTLITMEVTGLSYGKLMLEAVLPFSAFWIVGTWIGCLRAQKRLDGKESYQLNDDMKDFSSVEITPKQKRTTIAFLVTFAGLVVYGILTEQKTAYSLSVMLVLMTVVSIFGGININDAVKFVIKGASTQVNMFMAFVTFYVLLSMVTLGGGFEALSNLFLGLAKNGGPTGVMLASSLIGGFGIEAAAVVEIQIIAEMFGDLVREVGLPMGCFAVSILAATRLTGSTYPTNNFIGQMGTAQCDNTNEALQISWIGVAFCVVFVVLDAIFGPMILS